MKTNPLRQRLIMAWSRVPARERLMLTLLYFEGLTPVEAARALGCPVHEVEKTVELRLAKLLKLTRGSRRPAGKEPRRKAA
jgi:DNA-directed RNA polymerase specialized sigma24 family protein